MFIFYLLYIFTDDNLTPIPTKSEIKSIYFTRKDNKHFAEIVFMRPYHPTNIYLMGSDSGEPDDFRFINNLTEHAKYSDAGCSVTIKIVKRDLKKYLALHFYQLNKYFSTEVFIFSEKDNNYKIYRGEGTNWWLIGGIVAAVVFSLIIVVICIMRKSGNNMPISQPDDDL